MTGDDDDDVDTTGRGTRFVLWDFGRDFLQQMHSSLCCQQAIVVVVWRLRDTARAGVLGWLHSIADAFCAAVADGVYSKLPPLGVKVVLVATGLDEDPYSNDPDATQDLLQEIAETVAEAHELHDIIDIKAIMAVSCVDGRGVHDLQSLLAQIAPELAVWHERVAPSFVVFEAALQELARARASSDNALAPSLRSRGGVETSSSSLDLRHRAALSLDTMGRLALLCGVASDDVPRCLRYLHALGRIIHFNTTRDRLADRVNFLFSFIFLFVFYLKSTNKK